MDRSKPSAATSKLFGDAELVSFQDAMRLGDPLPPMQEQRQEEYHVETSRHYAEMQRHAALAALPPALQRRMSPMMQERQTMRQFWTQTTHPSGGAPILASKLFVRPPPLTHPAYNPYESCSPINSSSRAGYASPVGFAAASYAFGRYVPTQSVPASSAQKPYNLSAGAIQYQPASSNTTTSQYYQTHYAVPHRSNDASSVPDYMGGRRSVVHLSGIPLAQALRQPRTLEETRSVLLSGAPMDLQLVTFPDSAAHVVDLLLHHNTEEGADNDRERIRVTVLAGVRCRVHDFMESREGHEVLVALLRACAGRYAEVHAIVEAAVARNPNGRQRHSLRPTKHGYWETCLKELMTAAAPYHNLCAALVHVMEHTNGDQVVRHCFATMPYLDTMVLVQYAFRNMGAMLESVSGSKCLVECYTGAQRKELRAFQETLLTHAHTIARGEHSNYFVQHALEHGDVVTRRRLLDRLVGDGGDLVELALHCYGSYVAEACFQRTGMPYRVLAALLRLHDAQLVRLVRGKYSNYVVHKLLEFCKHTFPVESMNLARRIQALPWHVTDDMYTRKVMRVIKKLFPPLYSRMYHV
ncbi:hypothetical protein ACQ4PT_004847 [Festuca glaucescens]